MRIYRTGKIIDDFYVLGNAGSPVYLLDGPNPILFDAGITALAQLYEKDIRTYLGSRHPSYLFLTHAHFDHIGAAAYFKSLWPQMQIIGSAQTRKILSLPKAIHTIRILNQETKLEFNAFLGNSNYHAPFEAFDLDFVLTPGLILDLGLYNHIRPIHTPGHTNDFTSYWLPEKKVLVASEAVGCEDISGYISTEFLVDYNTYRESLKALTELDAQVLCTGHRLVLTGSDIKKYMNRSLKQAADYVAMLEELLRAEEGNIERVVAKVKAVEWDPKPWFKQPESAYLLNTRARVKSTWKHMKRRSMGFKD